MRAAAMAQQAAEGARPDVLAANEPQPVEAFVVAELELDVVDTVHAGPRDPGGTIAQAAARHNPCGKAGRRWISRLETETTGPGRGGRSLPDTERRAADADVD